MPTPRPATGTPANATPDREPARGPAHAPVHGSAQDVMVDRADPRAPVWRTITAVWQFLALHAMAELGIADQLQDGPLTTTELARRCDTQPELLARLLRALTAMGYLRLTGAPALTVGHAGTVSAQSAEERYGLTGQGAILHSHAPGTMRWAILSMGESGSWTAMTGLPCTIRTGRSPFLDAHGSIYGYLEQHPDAAGLFDRFMTERSADAAASLARHCDLSGVGRIADIGSGTGIITATLLRFAADPTCTAVLLDRPPVITAARAYMSEQGLDGRCDYAAGDYFTTVPDDADLYILGNIVHNLSDHDAIRLLRTVRAAMRPGSRLVCLDLLVPATPSDHISTYLDLRMMMLFPGGQERTVEHYASLLDQAGLHLEVVTPLPPTPMNALEASPGR